MTDLSSPRLMYLKAILFVCIGMISAGLILVECPSVRVVILLLLVIWSFARAYYFLFYVIQHYIDPTYRFAGLVSAGRYLMRKRKR